MLMVSLEPNPKGSAIQYAQPAPPQAVEVDLAAMSTLDAVTTASFEKPKQLALSPASESTPQPPSPKGRK